MICGTSMVVLQSNGLPKPYYPQEIYWDNNGNIHIMSATTVYVYKFPSLGSYSIMKSKHSYPQKIGPLVFYKIKPSIYKAIESFLTDKISRKDIK